MRRRVDGRIATCATGSRSAPDTGNRVRCSFSAASGGKQGEKQCTRRCFEDAVAQNGTGELHGIEVKQVLCRRARARTARPIRSEHGF